MFVATVKMELGVSLKCQSVSNPDVQTSLVLKMDIPFHRIPDPCGSSSVSLQQEEDKVSIRNHIYGDCTEKLDHFTLRMFLFLFVKQSSFWYVYFNK
jgi:hypothetical protein